MKENSSTYRHEMTIASELSALVLAREFVESAARECGFPEAVGFQIALAVDEACSNLIRHAYKNTQSATITLRSEKSSQGMIISIIDNAQSFNPLQVQLPDMQEYFRTYQHGGLGVHLMRRIMDKVEYFPSDAQQPQNELRLTKLLHPAS